LEILGPINENPQKSVKSTKHLKIEFQKIKNNFNPETHEIISYDSKNLFTTIDINFTKDFIIQKINKKPTYFFKNFCVKFGNGRTKFPPKTLFRTLLFNVPTNISNM
jgi:hypothetical protein